MKHWARPILILLLIYTALHLIYSVVRYNVFDGNSSGDFNRAYQEALDWRRSLQTGQRMGVFHPPLYYGLLLCLDSVFRGMKNLAYFFYFIQFLLFPWAIWLLAKGGAADPRLVSRRSLIAATLLCLNFQPFLETLAQHKVEGLEFVLICLAVVLYRRRRDLPAGALVMLAANLKYLPAILIGHFIWKREKKVLAGAALGGIAVLAVLTCWVGPIRVKEAVFQYPLELLFAHKYEGTVPEGSVEMQTLSGTVNRWFAQPLPGHTFEEYIRVGSYMPVPNPAFALRMAAALKGLLILGWLFVLRRRFPPQQRESLWRVHLLEISLSLVMIFVISQAARVHYAILLLPSFVYVALLLAQEPQRFRRPEKCLFAGAYFLSAMVIPGGLLNSSRLPAHPIWGNQYSLAYLWYSLPFYGTLLLGACIAVCLNRLYHVDEEDRGS